MATTVGSTDGPSNDLTVGATDGPTVGPDIAENIAQWRRLMSGRPGISADDVDELTDHLEAETADLRALGLTPDEAFLIAVKRIGPRDEVGREFTRVHPDRLWRQLVLGADEQSAASSTDPAPGGRSARRQLVSLLPALLLAVIASLAARLPMALLDDATGARFYPRNIGLLVLPPLICLLLLGHWRTRTPATGRIQRIGGIGGIATLLAVFAGSAVLVNVFPAGAHGQTFWLTAIHLPIGLVAVTAIAYLGPRWRHLGAWMDWVRFLGEAALYYVLIALSGGALTGVVVAIFRAIDIPMSTIDDVLGWVLPMGAAGAVIVCAWLVEHKKSVIENMAPVLTAVFTPLLGLALLVFLVVLVVTGNPVTTDRNVLIIFDAVLIAVAAIVLFTVSARSSERRSPALDWMQLGLIVVSLAVDLVMLWAMAGRLAEWGPSPNKIAGLGCNVLLLAHLSVSGGWYLRICLGRRDRAVAASTRLERWQCVAVPAFGIWALVVALALPPLFGWI
ncbi:MAG: permease prefix domain 1-containing protein [Acidipropionibacterium jensenii]|nr:permease prefix domain 1-containing protein [Acidipropionibacterium jensenii]